MEPIKIFVSHRIDLNSQLIDNPLYCPVRCGAMFDRENQRGLLGDDTGEHISQKRMTFCEFTVQYWAWKNVDADYYGLCHYRRYLSFSPQRHKTDQYDGMVHIPFFNQTSIHRFCLDDPERMSRIISEHDIIVSEAADIENVPLFPPTPSGKNTLLDFWQTNDGLLFENTSIDLMMELIEQRHPEMLSSAKEYFADHYHRGYNCFILRRELFDRLCRFQFDIMEEVEKRVDTTGYTETMKRTPAYVGEMLYGIFIYHITHHETHRVKELQLLFFHDTEMPRNLFSLWGKYLWFYLDRLARLILDPLFPKGSRRRQALKNLLYTLVPSKRPVVLQHWKGRG